MNKLFAKIRNRKGTLLIEVLLAVTVFSAGIFVIAMMIVDMKVNFWRNTDKVQAVFLAEEGIEAARFLRDVDFQNLSTGNYGLDFSSGVPVLTPSPDVTSKFTRQITISDVEEDVKRIDSSIIWDLTQNEQEEVVLTTYLTNWRKVIPEEIALIVDASGAHIHHKKLLGLTISNAGNTDIVIDKMTIWWDLEEPLLDRIHIDNAKVWSDIEGPGEPLGLQPSGTEIDVLDFVLPVGESFDLTFLRWNKKIGHAHDLTIHFLMGDGSTKELSFSL